VRDDLLYYYERELTYLRRLGADFAGRYPKVAGRLQLERDKCEDPHVERLLEGFAFLAARVHLKIDDDFPEISESFLNVVYPQYIRPLPSMSLVEFQLDPDQGKLTTGFRIPRDTLLYSRPVGGVPCKFRSCYDTVLWPLTVAGAGWSTPDRLHPPVKDAAAVAAFRLELQCLPEITFGSLEMDTLRLHLSGESGLVFTLYELLCNNCVRILVRDPTPGSNRKPILLPASSLRPVGFGRDEGVLPYPGHAFLAYRLLQEYFAFPDKFLFLDLSGFDALRAAGYGDRAEFVMLIAPHELSERRAMLESGVTARTIKLGCVPIVNLFPQTSEPILLDQHRHEYKITADARRALTTEIYSVDEVVGITPGSASPLRFEPFYAYRHGSDRAEHELFWYAKRRPVGWRPESGTDVFLSFVDLSNRIAHPDLDAVTARLTCFNGDLPSRLPFGDDAGDFELPGGGPIRKIVALVKPTGAVQPPLGKPQLWRLISLLSLNYLSLVDGGTDALRELLRLHNFGEATAGDRQIEAILAVRSAPHFARVVGEYGVSFARGRRVEIEFDETQFAGAGLYLFASVLEHFLGLYASLNSFSVLAAKSQQRKRPVREWAPRAGWKPLL
jgi:type VI secretion system protein ImpG